MHTQEVVCTGLSEGVCVHMVECTAHCESVPILGIGGLGVRAGGSTPIYRVIVMGDIRDADASENR